MDNEQKKSDGQLLQDATNKFLNDVETDKKMREEQQRLEEDLKAVNFGELRQMTSDKITKAELAEIVKAQNKKIDDVKKYLLTAKYQGRAHISEENADPNEEIAKIYGQDSMVARIFRKK